MSMNCVTKSAVLREKRRERRESIAYNKKMDAFYAKCDRKEARDIERVEKRESKKFEYLAPLIIKIRDIVTRNGGFYKGEYELVKTRVQSDIDYKLSLCTKGKDFFVRVISFHYQTEFHYDADDRCTTSIEVDKSTMWKIAIHKKTQHEEIPRISRILLNSGAEHEIIELRLKDLLCELLREH